MSTNSEVRRCRYCGKPFTVDEMEGLYWYCSPECRDRAWEERQSRRKEAGRKAREAFLGRVRQEGKTKICPICGRKFRVQSTKHKYCSDFCYAVANWRRPSEYYVFWRDGFRCRYCGRTPADGVRLVVDHVFPRKHAEGEPNVNHPINLVTACEECNSRKNATIFDAKLLFQIWQENVSLAQRRSPKEFRELFLRFVQEHPKEVEKLDILMDWEQFIGARQC